MAGFFEVLVHWRFLLDGVWWTLLISIVAMLGGSLVGLVTALARLSRFRALDWAASLYIDFFRTTPLLVQLVWVYYALPILTGISMSSFEAGSLAMSLYSGAFLSEIIRAGIFSIEKGQTEAAAALGMHPLQILQRIVLPQALARMIPPITSSFITQIKDSGLCYVIAVPELMRQAEALAAFTFRGSQTLTIAAFIYLGLTYPLSLIANTLQRRLAVVS